MCEKEKGEVLKLEKIERHVDLIDHSVNSLVQLCNDQDAEIRYRALEALQQIDTPVVRDIVYTALSDPDEIVVATCLEIIGGWGDCDRPDVMINLLSDRRDLVRSATAVVIGIIGLKNAKNKLIERLDVCDDEEKFSLYFALYMIGNNQYIFHFLNGIFHPFYRIRCATSNLLAHIITNNNKEFIANLLSEVLKNEETEAAKSSIIGVLNHIREGEE